MKKCLPLLIALLLLVPALRAQDCDGMRFDHPVFEDLTTTSNIPYGRATTVGGKNQVLLMDVYEPAGDTMKARPLIVLAHGGAFVTGDRTQTAELCEEFAMRGYVVANIAYRLIDKILLDSTGLHGAAMMSVMDMRAAIRYFREDAHKDNQFKVDTSLIFAAGISAGGIMASQVGYLDREDDIPTHIQKIIDNLGGFEGNSSYNTKYTSAVHGVLNYSGALLRVGWIDADDPPLYSAHDDMDNVVPCAYGNSDLIPFPLYLYGSCAMTTHAETIGISNQLHLISNSSKHVSYFKESGPAQLVIDESASFLKSIICSATGIEPALSASAARASVYPNPFESRVSIDYPGQIRGISVFDIRGTLVWQLRNPDSKDLELGHLPGGLYIFQIESPEGNIMLKVLKH